MYNLTLFSNLTKRMKNIFFIFFICILLFHQTVALALSPYSTNELDSLEKEFIQLINQSQQIERTPLAREYINQTGKKLAKFAQIPTPYFFIVKSSEINAFAGPGGYIGINTELILASATESELAAVMAHEIAHVRLHHLYNIITHEKQMKIPMLALLLASVALGVLNPTLGSGALMATMSGMAQDSINFTRSQEKEADRIGIDMLMKANYDPRGMAGFFKKMQQHTRYYYTANIPPILRSHPMDDERIAEAENRSTHLTKQAYSASEDYPLFKELIRLSVTSNYKALLEYYRIECPRHNIGTVCQYGQALTDLAINHYSEAQGLLQNLIPQKSNNLFYNIALAQAETGLGNYSIALTRLQNLLANYPESYALIMAYAETLMAANQNEKAVFTLLKGSRLYPKDLPLCHTFAQAQSDAHKESYAYFSRAQCLLLEGKLKAARAQLKVARNLAKKDEYLQSRIDAKLIDIKNAQD
jgi:predicted Zn-dependent protease